MEAMVLEEDVDIILGEDLEAAAADQLQRRQVLLFGCDVVWRWRQSEEI
jgi:hypothetical protein